MKKDLLINMMCIISITIQISVNAQMMNPGNVTYDWKTDTTRHNVELSEFMMVLQKGTFPVLNTPEFIDKNAGLKVYSKNEPVIYLEINMKSKAYPLNVLSAHELVNDTIEGTSILISYCPLCNSALIFNRTHCFNGDKYT